MTTAVRYHLAFLLLSALASGGCDFFGTDSSPAGTSPKTSSGRVAGDAGHDAASRDPRPSGMDLPDATAAESHGGRPGQRDDPFQLVGRWLPSWQLNEWAHSGPIAWTDLRGRVVLVRFWTDDSPCCQRSMKAIVRLAEQFKGRPVTFVGIYYSRRQQSGDEDWKSAVAEADRWGVTFPIANDRYGQTLWLWWERRFPLMPRSASFVVDPDGRVALVHPGPEFHATSDPFHAQCNRDYLEIRGAIERCLPRKLAEHVR